MTPLTQAEAFAAIKGAFRLFLRDRNGLAYFRTDGPALLNSFWAAIIVMPGWYLLDYLTESGIWMDVPFIPGLVMELAGYSMMWTVWPQIMLLIVKFLDRDDRYNIYIIAQNWMAVPSVLLYLVTVGGATITGQPDLTIQIVALVSAIWILFYHFYVLRVSLKVTAPIAVGLVLANFVLNVILLDIRMVILMG